MRFLGSLRGKSEQATESLRGHVSLSSQAVPAFTTACRPYTATATPVPVAAKTPACSSDAMRMKQSTTDGSN